MITNQVGNFIVKAVKTILGQVGQARAPHVRMIYGVDKSQLQNDLKDQYSETDLHTYYDHYMGRELQHKSDNNISSQVLTDIAPQV